MNLEPGHAEPIPLLFCGKYQITQGPNGMLLACDASDGGMTLAITERNIEAMIFAAGLFQLSPLPGEAVGLTHFGNSTD